MYAASNTVYPRIVTGSAGSIQYSAFGTTHAIGPTDLVIPLAQGTITTATTTTLYQPAAGTEAQIRHITVSNDHASVSNFIEIMAFDGTTDRLLWRGTLEIGETLHWVERDGVWRVYNSDGFFKTTTNENAGDAFPSAIYHGRPWYRTDLNWLFHYDSDRAKWLGELELYQFGRNGNVAANNFLRYGGNVIASSTGSGAFVPHTATCVGMTGQHNTAPTGGDIVLYGSLVKISKLEFTAAFDFAKDMLLDDDIVADSLLSVQWGDFEGALSPAAITDPIVNVFLRRRAP